MPLYLAPPSRAVPGALTAGLIASTFAVPMLVIGYLPRGITALLVVLLIAGHALAWRGATQLMRQRPVHDRASASTARGGFAIAGLSALMMGTVAAGFEPIMELLFVERGATIVAWFALGRVPSPRSRAAPVITLGHLVLVIAAQVGFPFAATSHCLCHGPERRPMTAILVGLLTVAVTLGLVQLAQWRATPAPPVVRRLDAFAAIIDLTALIALAGAPIAIGAWRGPPADPLATVILAPFALAMLLFVSADRLRRAARRAALPVAIALRGHR